MSENSYVLRIKSKGIKIGDSTDGSNDLVVYKDSKAVATYNNIRMELSLYGISVHKRVYEPGHVQAELLIVTKKAQVPDVGDLTDMFSHRQVKLAVNGHAVAEDYFVHELLPQYGSFNEPGTQNPNNTYAYTYVRLDMYSPDLLLTLNKYSQAFLGRRLITDIVTAKLGDFTNGDIVISKELGTLPHLVYKGTIKKLKENSTTEYVTTEEDMEMIHPYLVQYNESFYDFLKRVANRCGEVFFFEGGKLTFGIPAENATTNPTVPIKNPSRIVYQRTGGSAFQVDDYVRDTVKGSWKDGTLTYMPDKTIKDPVDNLDHGFPADAYATRTKDQENDYAHFYNSEIASPDHYVLLYKGKFALDDSTNLWWGKTDQHLMGWMGDLLNSSSLLEFITNWTKDSVEKGFLNIRKVDSENDAGAEVVDELRLNDDDTYGVLFAKVDNNLSHWVTLDYYQGIRRKEQEQMRKMVCIDMGSSYAHVKLGTRITLPTDKNNVYVVVGLEMNSATPWQCQYDHYAGGEPQPNTEYQRIYAIPLAAGVFYPPLLDEKPFRLSGPQPAFVTDSDDPTGQGRVRVRLAWQPTLKKIDDDIDNAQKTLDLVQSVLDSMERKVKKYGKEDPSNKGHYVKKKSASDEDFNDANDDYERMLADRDDKKATLKALKAKRADEENATPWIRMSTPMATAGGGMFFRPEVGDEVMLDFENGNVERPYVVGTLYSKNVTAPFQGDRVIVSKNGHTIKLDDPSDGTSLLAGMYPGLKFLSSYGVKLPDLQGNVNKVLGGIELCDQLGFYSIKMSSHNRNISISSPFGDVSVDAFTGISINAPNGDISISGKNVEIQAGNRLTLTSGKNIKADDGYLSYVKTDIKSVGKTVTGALASKAPAKFFDLSLMRNILEVFVRPVDGTLEIKSGRYLLLESGNGEANVQSPFYEPHKVYKDMIDGTPIQAFIYMFPYTKGQIRWFAAEFRRRFNAVCERVAIIRMLNEFYMFEDDNNNRVLKKRLKTPADKKTLLTDLYAMDVELLDDPISLLKKQGDYIKEKVSFITPSDNGGFEVSLTERDQIQEAIKQLMGAILSLKWLAVKYENLLSMVNDRTSKATVHKDTRWEQFRALVKLPKLSYVNASKDVLTKKKLDPDSQDDTNILYDKFFKFISLDSNPDLFDTPLQEGVFDNSVKWMSRLMAYQILKRCNDNEDLFESFKVKVDQYPPDAQGRPAAPQLNHADMPINDHDWDIFLTGVKIEKIDVEQGKVAKFVAGAKQAVKDALKKVTVVEKHVWGPTAKGEILFSNSEDTTFRFLENGQTQSYTNHEFGKEGNGEISTESLQEKLKAFK